MGSSQKTLPKNSFYTHAFDHQLLIVATSNCCNETPLIDLYPTSNCCNETPLIIWYEINW
jgi:hypothetical protein